MTSSPVSHKFFGTRANDGRADQVRSAGQSLSLKKLAKRKLLVERLENRVLMTATLGVDESPDNPGGRCIGMEWASSARIASFDFRTMVPSSMQAPEVVAPQVVDASEPEASVLPDSGGFVIDVGSGSGDGVSGDVGSVGGDTGEVGGESGSGPTVVGAPSDWQVYEPSRTVTQWIEGVYHRWDEFDVAGSNEFFVVMTRPEPKPLSAAESAELMVRSASWLYFDPLPIDPSLSSTVDPSELAKLPTAQPPYISSADANDGRTVLGDDDRVRVPFESVQIAPWYNVGFQSNTYPTNESFRCTAFAVTPNVALTNGHCVFNSGRGGYVTSARFTPGQFQATAGGTVVRPFGGPYSATAWETNPTYLTDPSDASAHDYAAMFFENGFVGLGITTFAPLVFNAVPSQVEIIGYPGSAQGESTQTMWTHSGAATVGSDNRVLTYVADSSGGNSGGPMWEWVNGSPRVVGIHAFGSTNFNGGPRLTSHNIDIVEDWLLWTPDNGGEDIGDTLATAELTQLGPASGTYEIDSQLGDGPQAALDVDLFQFTATAGSTLRIETSALAGGTNVDTMLRLFDAAGTELAFNDDSGSFYSLIDFTIVDSGVYYVGVSGFPNFGYNPAVAGSGQSGAAGDYTLVIELIEPAPQDEPLVGVDFGPAGSASPTNWTLYSGGGAQFTMTNLIDETGAVTPIDLSIRTLNSTGNFFTDTSLPPANFIPSHSQSLARIDGNIWADADVEFLWTDLTPNETYEIYVFASDTVDFSTDYIVYGAGNPYTFNQTVAANTLHVNDSIGDSSRDLLSYAIIVEADATGQIRVETSKLTNFIGFAGVAIRQGEPLPPSGGISGFNWNDLNGDGVWDAGEPGLPGWMIYIDTNSNGELDTDEPTAITGDDGSYQFAGLLPGAYVVSQIGQTDWVQTYPGNESQPESGSNRGGSSLGDPNAGDPAFDPEAARQRLLKIAERVSDNPNYRIDESGNILAINPNVYNSIALESFDDGDADELFPLSETFFLNSLPGANKTIYLDFDGHTTTNTFWNSSFTSNNPIITPPYTLDSDPAFSNAELTQIQQIWEMMSEDFRPFNVNVTTQDPGIAALVNSGGTDNQWGIRVVFGDNNWFDPVGGVAYLGSFNWNNDTPTFVFNRGLIGAAEAGSHEVGHTLGLVHDGRTGEEYYGGHGTGATGWAPIMGVGYSRQLVQWSRGQYPDASNQEDDLQMIVSNNGFGYRADDHGGTFATATILNTTPSAAPGLVDVSDEGIIERNTDVDYFVFTTGAGVITLSIDPFYRSPNLDILANLYDTDGLLLSSNPVNALDASFQVDLPAGTYYLTVEGTGKAANGNDFGYSDYGSLGYYSITGTLIASTRPGTHLVFVGNQVVPNVNFGNRFDGPLVAEIHGFKWHDENEDGVWDADEPGLEGWTIYLDENENGQFDNGERFVVTGPDGSYSFTDLAPGTYFVGEVMQDGWAQTFPDFQTPDSAGGFGSASGGSGATGAVSGRNSAGGFVTAAPGKGDDATTLVNTTANLPGDVTNSSTSLVAMALQRVADLSQYSAQQLAETTKWVVMLDPTTSPRDVAATAGGRLVSSLPLFANSYVIEYPQGYQVETAITAMDDSPGMSLFFPLIAEQRNRRLIPNDPLFVDQWHLRNTGQTGGTAGADSRATVAWDSYLGTGVVIAVVDDGVQHSHPDLIDRYLPAFSFDFNGNDPDPTPTSNFDNHGTAVAGVAAASGNNGIGVSGAAPGASLTGIRLIAGPSTDLMESLALTLHNQDNDIYNNSWGPFDTGTIESGSRPGPLTLAALESGVNDGRGGLGSIFVWAGGNGQGNEDNVNYDGYANSRFTIAVGAIDDDGIQSSYSEPGAPLIISAYSSGGAVGITTTDLIANGSYTDSFGGTSSATPLVAGVIALMLEANPNLGWRDVQNILIDSASLNHPSDSDWVANGAGRMVNHKYGYGAIDAAAAVTLAENWTNLGPEVSASSGVINVGQSIPDANTTGVTSSFTLDAAIDLEYVEIIFNATHTYRGDLHIVLTSPSGTESILAEERGDSGDNYDNWVFTSARLWGEAAAGEWTLTVRDLVGADVGTFVSWQINAYGTSNETAIEGFHQVDLAGGQVVTDVNFGNRTLDTISPVVSNFMIGSSGYAPAFVNHVASGQVGISATEGSISPWGRIDQLHVQFSEPVEGFTQNNIDLRGINVPNYNPLITSVSYDAANNRGMIQLSAPIGRDRLRLSVSPNVTDVSGNPLDGDSNGTGGDVFSRLFNVLPGDASGDGSVNGSDLVFFSASFNRSIGSPSYNAFADWSGDGSVNGADLVFFSSNFNRSLPNGVPGGPIFPIPAAGPESFAARDSRSEPFLTMLSKMGTPKRPITMEDLAPFIASFNRSVGSPSYNPAVDYNNDGSVNGGDLVVMWQIFNGDDSSPKYRVSQIVKPSEVAVADDSRTTKIEDAVFGDEDTQWNEPADGIELLFS